MFGTTDIPTLSIRNSPTVRAREFFLLQITPKGSVSTMETCAVGKVLKTATAHEIHRKHGRRIYIGEHVVHLLLGQSLLTRERPKRFCGRLTSETRQNERQCIE